MDEEPNRLVERAVLQMKRLGLSQADVARRGGFNRVFVSDLLRGKKSRLHPSNYPRLAKALGTTVAYLRSGVEPDQEQELELIRGGWLPPPPEDVAAMEEIDFGSSPPTRDLGVPAFRSDGRLDGGALLELPSREFLPLPTTVQFQSWYAVGISDTLMSPRYEPGEFVYAAEGAGALPKDFVVAKIRGRSGRKDVTVGYVRQFLRAMAEQVVLRQLSPSMELSFPRSRVVAIDRVVLSGEPFGGRNDWASS